MPRSAEEYEAWIVSLQTALDVSTARLAEASAERDAALLEVARLRDLFLNGDANA